MRGAFCLGAGPASVGVGSHGAALGGKPRRWAADLLGIERFPSRGATLDLDFVNRQAYAYGTGTVAPENLFAITGSGGTRFNEAGLLVSSASAPRYNYDPQTFACRGLLVEEQSTNMLLHSNAFDDVYWLKTRSSVTPNAVTALDGTNTGYKLVEDTTAANNHYLGKTSGFTLTNGTSYVFSIPMSAAERQVVVITWFGLAQGEAVFDLVNGKVFKNAAVADANMIPLGGGRWLIWTAWNYTGTGVGPIVSLSTSINPSSSAAVTVYTGDGVSGAYVLGDAQLEIGSFPTSVIRTTTAQVTRTADIVTMSGNRFASWYNPIEGTGLVSGDTYNNAAASFYNICDSGGAGSVERQQVRANGAAGNNFQSFMGTGGVIQASASTGAWVRNAIANLAWAYRANDFGFCANGGAVVRVNSGNVNIPTELRIGRFGTGGETLNGHVRRLRYYPQRMADSLLSRLTQ